MNEVTLSRGVLTLSKDQFVDAERVVENYIDTIDSNRQERNRVEFSICFHTVVSEYEIEETETRYLIREHQTITDLWLLWPAMISLLFGVFFGYLSGVAQTLLTLWPFLTTIIGYGLPALSAVATIPTFTVMWYRPMIANNLSELSISFSNDVTILRHFAAFGILALAGIGCWTIQYHLGVAASGVALLCLSVVIVSGIGFDTDPTLETVPNRYIRELMGSPVSGRFCWYIFASLTSLLVFRVFWDVSKSHTFTSILMGIVLIVVLGTLISYPGFFLRHQGIPDFEYVRFSTNTQREKLHRYSYGVIAVGLTWSTFYTAVNTFHTIQLFNLRAAVFAIAMIPALYLVSGLLLQLASLFWFVRWLFNHSASTSDVMIEGFDGSIRVLNRSGFFAGSYSILGKSYIFISKPVHRELDKPVREAVLAHEFAHIERGEATLGFLIPVVASVMGVPKNIIYSVFPFQQWELDADQYAKNRTSRDAVVSALEVFEGGSSTLPGGVLGLQPNFHSFSGIQSGSGTVEALFGYFFGGFALSRAHPSIDERKQSLGE